MLQMNVYVQFEHLCSCTYIPIRFTWAVVESWMSSCVFLSVYLECSVADVLCGRQWEMSPSNKPIKKKEEKVQHGGELHLLLITVCPNLPALGQSLLLFLLLNHSLLSAQPRRYESPFVAFLHCPPLSLCSFPSVSISKPPKSTLWLLYKSFIVMVYGLPPCLPNICFAGSRRRKFLSRLVITFVNAQIRAKRRKDEKSVRFRHSDMSEGSSVTGCHWAVLWDNMLLLNTCLWQSQSQAGTGHFSA